MPGPGQYFISPSTHASPASPLPASPLPASPLPASPLPASPLPASPLPASLLLLLLLPPPPPSPPPWTSDEHPSAMEPAMSTATARSARTQVCLGRRSMVTSALHGPVQHFSCQHQCQHRGRCCMHMRTL